MIDLIAEIFKNKRVVRDRLVPFGFIECGGEFEYKKSLTESRLELCVRVAGDGRVSALISDPAFGEPYTLHLNEEATGGYVGAVRREYENVLREIAGACCEPFVFKTAQARMCIEYVRDKYGDELEFLWEKFPNDAIWRRADNKKWYAVLLTVPAAKLGLAGGDVEIIDLRMDPAQKSAIVDGHKYLPGYHMNKNSWFTAVLNGSVPDPELKNRIDISFDLAKKK